MAMNLDSSKLDQVFGNDESLEAQKEELFDMEMLTEAEVLAYEMEMEMDSSYHIESSDNIHYMEYVKEIVSDFLEDVTANQELEHYTTNIDKVCEELEINTSFQSDVKEMVYEWITENV